MGQKKVGTPTTPKAWANHLSRLLKIFHEFHGLNRFPVDVAAVAQEFSKQFFPDQSITLIAGQAMSTKFEGMLLPSPHKRGEWGILYNNSIGSKGRRNYTLAHELGHYFLHRHLSPQGIQCTNRDMHDWRSDYAKLESEANTFASFLLMPLDDFRVQISGQSISIALMEHLAERYAVSLTAAILKWLSITEERAMIVVGKSGFIDWSWSSERLLVSGVFRRARQEIIELPPLSIAAKQGIFIDSAKGFTHPKGVWSSDEEVLEMTVFSEPLEMSISLLLYPKDAPIRPKL